MSKKPVSEAELRLQLRDQIAFLRTSCNFFDKGDSHEGKRIALLVRILVHNTQQSRSLLMQLGYENALQFVSRALMKRPCSGPYHGLLNIAFGKTIRYVPKFDDEDARPMLFEDWWNEPVLKDAGGTFYSRRELVLAVANTDGGAHVDPEMDETYSKLSRENHVGYEVAVGGKAIQWHENPVLPSLRQIGHEILETLDSVP